MGAQGGPWGVLGGALGGIWAQEWPKLKKAPKSELADPPLGAKLGAKMTQNSLKVWKNSSRNTSQGTSWKNIAK